MRYLILTLILFSYLSGFAQESRVQKLIAQGKEQLRKEKFIEAEKTFKRAFSVNETLPDELCFYYGVALVKLKKYVQARDFLNKYVSLTNKKGEFINETNTLLLEIQKNVCNICNGTNIIYQEDTCSLCHGNGYKLDNCMACHGKDKVTCPVCLGAKVIVTTNSLGTWYNDCVRCEDGTVTCLRCNGLKQEKVICPKCKGTKTEKTEKKCTNIH